MAIERDIRDGRMPLFSHNLIRYRQKNILYLQSSQSEMNRRALDGVRRFASKVGWNLTALHYGAAAKAGDRAGSFCSPRVLGEVLAGRRPDGCIVEDSAVWKRMIPVMEKSRVPCVIYDAQFPAALSGGFTRVICDNVAVVDAAVKELFSFGLDDYAVVPHHEPLAWSKIREMRFELAKRQLTTGSLSIDAIAEFCGYDSASTLRKLFDRRLGCSPLRWRKGERQKFAEKSRF